MPTDIVQRFIDRLQQGEADRSPERIAELFAEGARLARPVRGGAHDEQPPLEFWRGYLAAFERIASRFEHVNESEGFAALEWTSAATLPGGRELVYRGVTLLHHDGRRLTALRTYYDSAPFAPSPPAAKVPAQTAPEHHGRDEPTQRRRPTGGRRPTHPTRADPAQEAADPADKTGGRKGSPPPAAPSIDDELA